MSWTRVLGAIACVVLVARVSHAQTTGQGWIVGGAGTHSNPFTSGLVVQAAGGGEVIVQSRLSIGGEAGLLIGGDVGTPVSLDVSLHRPRKMSRSVWSRSCSAALRASSPSLNPAATTR
jgi:hypothetical protein